MIEKPKQYFDTRSHQLYYQWDESEYFSHQEPIYDRTREYIESLEAENAKLRTALSAVLQCSGITKRDKGCDACPMYDKEKEYVRAGDWCGIRQFIRELGVVVE